MSKTKELFMQIREHELNDQQQADISEQEFTFLQTNKINQNANRSNNNGITGL